MFGMVLAIGIIVDDAIVVVENVERIMATEGLSPKSNLQSDERNHQPNYWYYLVLPQYSYRWHLPVVQSELSINNLP
jgi:hypothetical protein